MVEGLQVVEGEQLIGSQMDNCECCSWGAEVMVDVEGMEGGWKLSISRFVNTKSVC